MPQLFLYSTADALIRDSDIEAFVRERRQLGVKCHAHRWQHSPHVQHYRSLGSAY